MRRRGIHILYGIFPVSTILCPELAFVREKLILIWNLIVQLHVKLRRTASFTRVCYTITQTRTQTQPDVIICVQYLRYSGILHLKRKRFVLDLSRQHGGLICRDLMPHLTSRNVGKQSPIQAAHYPQEMMHQLRRCESPKIRNIGFVSYRQIVG